MRCSSRWFSLCKLLSLAIALAASAAALGGMIHLIVSGRITDIMRARVADSGQVSLMDTVPSAGWPAFLLGCVIGSVSWGLFAYLVWLGNKTVRGNCEGEFHGDANQEEGPGNMAQ